MIPSGRLVALAALPLLLAALVPWLPGAWMPQLALDLCLVLIALADRLASRASVQVERSLRGTQVVGRPFQVALRVRSRAGRRLRVRLTDALPGAVEGLPAEVWVAAGDEVEVEARVVVRRRGLFELGPAQIRVASILGLWWLERPVAGRGTLRVTPRWTSVRRGGVPAPDDAARRPVRARRRAGGESEFERLRPYVAGDPLKRVDWRATARRRSLVSRDYQQEVNQSVVIVLDAGRAMCGLGASLARFDEAVDAALRLAYLASARGDRVGLLVYDDQVRSWVPPRGGREVGVRLLRALSEVEPREVESDPRAAARFLRVHLRKRSLAVVVGALIDEAQAAEVGGALRALRSRHLPIFAALRDSGVAELLQAGDPWQRAAAAELLQPVEEAVRALRAQGVLALDVPSDRLSGELISSYLEVKARRLL